MPELDLSIHPDLNNEGFICNIEGILTRAGMSYDSSSRSLERRKRKERAGLLLKVQRATEGKLRFTLVLKNPLGNSTIISEKAKKRRIGKRELKELKFGEQTIAVRNVQ